MKTSLLLMGLALGAGIVGTARAADATDCTHALRLENHSLARASLAGDGLLSDLDSMLSGHQTKSDANADSDSGNSSGQAYHAPGPAPSTGTQGNRNNSHAGAHAHDNSPPATLNIHADRVLSPASGSSDNSPALGWQSLLPGSIQ